MSVGYPFWVSLNLETWKGLNFTVIESWGFHFELYALVLIRWVDTSIGIGFFDILIWYLSKHRVWYPTIVRIIQNHHSPPKLPSKGGTLILLKPFFNHFEPIFSLFSDFLETPRCITHHLDVVAASACGVRRRSGGFPADRCMEKWSPHLETSTWWKVGDVQVSDFLCRIILDHVGLLDHIRSNNCRIWIDSQWFTTFWDNFTSMLQPPGAGLRLWMLMANLVVHKARAQAKSPSSHRSFARSKRILLIACRMLFTRSIQNTAIIMLHAQILELNSNTVSSNAKTWSILEHPVKSSISKSRARLLESINVPMPFGFVS